MTTRSRQINAFFWSSNISVSTATHLKTYQGAVSTVLVFHRFLQHNTNTNNGIHLGFVRN